MMRGVRVVLVLAAVAVAAAACSSGSKTDAATDSSTATSPGQAPEDLRASAAEVAKGLRQIETTATDLAKAAGSDKGRAQALAGRIEPVWKTIEGTIKANDQDAYISFEDSFAVLKTAADEGDAAKAQQGADAVSKAVAAYLVKYPG